MFSNIRTFLFKKNVKYQEIEKSMYSFNKI